MSRPYSYALDTRGLTHRSLMLQHKWMTSLAAFNTQPPKLTLPQHRHLPAREDETQRNQCPYCIVLSCLVRVVVLGHQRPGDRVVMGHPMVPTAWPSNGPRFIVGIALPWVSWADKILEPW